MKLIKIATIHTEFSDKFGIPRQSGLVPALRAEIVFEPEFRTMDAIKAEWKKEIIGEGYIVDCYKRWNEGYSGRIPQNINTVQQGPSFNEKECPAGFQKFVWAIPDEERKVNDNLVQNPGW